MTAAHKQLFNFHSRPWALEHRISRAPRHQRHSAHPIDFRSDRIFQFFTMHSLEIVAFHAICVSRTLRKRHNPLALLLRVSRSQLTFRRSRSYAVARYSLLPRARFAANVKFRTISSFLAATAESGTRLGHRTKDFYATRPTDAQLAILQFPQVIYPSQRGSRYMSD